MRQRKFAAPSIQARQGFCLVKVEGIMDEKLLILISLIGLLLQPILIAVGILISKKESLKWVALCVHIFCVVFMLVVFMLLATIFVEY